jgi:thioredoxin-like negative regulator of GroEL
MIFISQESDLVFDNPCVMYFYTSWMPYHKKMLVMLDKMEEKYKMKFFGINADNFKPICKRFNIDSVPTVLIFDKKELKRINGLVLTSAFRKAFADICNMND